MTAALPVFRRPPGPNRPVSLGVDAGTLATLSELRRSYGEIVAVTGPNGRLAYFVNEPDEVRRILVRRHRKYVKGPGFERVKLLLGNGLIVSDGEVWRRSRTMIQPAFSRQNIHRLLGVMVECCDRVAARWAAAAAAGAEINVTEETSDFALELILKSIFGADHEARIVADGSNPFAFLSQDPARDLGVVLKVRSLRQMLLDVIAARRAGPGRDDFDFLSMYLAATDRDGVAFTDEELLDELLTLIVAGFETSANTLNWAWYLLARHPEVEARMLDEVSAALPCATLVSADAVTGMVYTQRVLEETLRLYPPVWLFTRRADEEDELVDYDVPAGTDIYLSPYILHRSERFWPEPERFDPERFAGDDPPKKEGAYFPFSLGPRRCLGEYFSFLEMKVHLGRLLPRFRMRPVDDTEPGMELGINLRSADDILLRPEARR